MITIRKAILSEYGDVKQFYYDRNYEGSLNEAAIVLIALQHQQMIGVVQLCPEDGYCALRGMQIHPAFQRQGIGSQLLHEATLSIGNQPCYCIPWSHLEPFYQQIGFQKVALDKAPENGHIPAELSDRYTRYLNQGLDVVLMQRLA